MACPGCGSPVTTSDRFCASCGSPLAASAPTTASLPVSEAAPAAAPPAAAPAPPGVPLPVSFGAGRYQVSRFLGEGGRKRVYQAYDRALDREVAVPQALLSATLDEGWEQMAATLGFIQASADPALAWVGGFGLAGFALSGS